LQVGYTDISRTVAGRGKGDEKRGRNLLLRMTCYFYINVAGREVNESLVLSVEIIVRDLVPAASKPALRAYHRD